MARESHAERKLSDARSRVGQVIVFDCLSPVTPRRGGADTWLPADLSPVQLGWRVPAHPLSRLQSRVTAEHYVSAIRFATRKAAGRVHVQREALGLTVPQLLLAQARGDRVRHGANDRFWHQARLGRTSASGRSDPLTGGHSNGRNPRAFADPECPKR